MSANWRLVFGLYFSEISRASSKNGVSSIREILASAVGAHDDDEDSQSDCLSSLCPSDFDLDLSSSEDEQEDEAGDEGDVKPNSTGESNGDVSPVSSANLSR